MRETTDQFWNLLKTEHGAAAAFCRKLCRNRDEGDDLYQDAVYRARTRFGQLQDVAAFKGWFYRIILNSHRNRLDSGWFRRIVSLGTSHLAIASEENLESRSLSRQRLSIALGAISPDDRALVLMHDLEGWTIPELAVAFERTEDALKARLSRARKKAKKVLEKHLNRISRAAKTTNADNRNGQCVATKLERE